jgi:hypothetical protein
MRSHPQRRGKDALAAGKCRIQAPETLVLCWSKLQAPSRRKIGQVVGLVSPPESRSPPDPDPADPETVSAVDPDDEPADQTAGHEKIDRLPDWPYCQWVFVGRGARARLPLVTEHQDEVGTCRTGPTRTSARTRRGFLAGLVSQPSMPLLALIPRSGEISPVAVFKSPSDTHTGKFPVNQASLEHAGWLAPWSGCLRPGGPCWLLPAGRRL